jgi:HSP20 family molecular chaperone IbpA
MEKKIFKKGIHQGKLFDIDIDIDEMLMDGKKGVHVFHKKMGKHGLHHEKKVFQKVIDEDLLIYFILPGVDKSDVDFRIKPDTIALDASIKEDLKDVMGKQEISLKINLVERIKVDGVIAKLEDGILKVRAKLETIGVNIEVE